MSYILSFGSACVILLFGSFLLSLRSRKRISLEERLYHVNNMEPVAKEKDDSFLKKLDRDLQHSRTGITVPIYFMIMLVSVLLIYFVGNYLTESSAASLIACACGILIPREVVSTVAKARRREFDALFSKSLRRISASLRTGSTLVQSIEELVSSPNMSLYLREEFQKVLIDYEYNRSMENAFYALYERTGVEDIKSVAMAISIGSQRGTKIYETFETFANAIQERKEAEAKANAALAEKKTETVVLALMPFAVTLLFKYSTPGYFEPLMQLWGGMGQYLMIGMYLLVGVGFVICRKVTDIKL